MSRRLLVVIALVAACGPAPKHANEPELAGGESPAAFQRAIGLTLLRTNEPRRAIPYLQRLARLEPTRAEPRCNLARAFIAMAMWDQARASLDAALVLQPTYAPAHALLGVLLDARGQHLEAQVAHRRAGELDPDNPAYPNNLGFSLYLDGRYLEAVAAYGEALRLGPNVQRIHNNLGFTLGKLGRFAEAAVQFRISGGPAEADNNMGMVFEDRGELGQAYDAFVAAVRAAPNLVAARENLERICHRLDRPMPAIPERSE